MATKKNTVRKKGNRKTPLPTALHGHNESGSEHVVGLLNLRVVIVPDGKLWFAQGLDIDYAAQGTSIEDAKKQFEDGFVATVHEHLKVFGTIDKLLSVAPNEVWQEMLYAPKAKHQLYSQVSTHSIAKEGELEALPFKGIEYLVAAHAAGQ